jgi:2-polyprenyl-6-methoxyphenol hydroxylase-like FAD-dependent oxidoreductase
MTSWSRGRVTLVGDAGYCPGPAVGGSTSLSVLGAYVLAGELERAAGYRTAFRTYEEAMREPVLRSRAFARGAAKRLIPTTRLGVRTLVLAAQLISALPTGLTRSLVKFNDKGIRLYDSMRVPDYPVATA